MKISDTKQVAHSNAKKIKKRVAKDLSNSLIASFIDFQKGVFYVTAQQF